MSPVFTTSHSSSARSTTRFVGDCRIVAPAIVTSVPSTKYTARFVSPLRAGGSVSVPPGASVISHMATSFAGSLANESGGGGRAAFPMSSPAQTVATARPSSAITFGTWEVMWEAMWEVMWEVMAEMVKWRGVVCVCGGVC